MKLVHKQLILASMLACVGMAATAQTPTADAANAAKGPAATHERHERGGRMDPAKMQEFQAKRMAALKAKLKITPAQESAWTTFNSDMHTQMQPPGPRPERGEMEKLTTPQRLDKMREMRAQHAAAADKRDATVKTFYATLSAEQQKTFDTETRHMGPRGGRHGGPGRDGGPRGEHHHGGASKPAAPAATQ